MLPSVCFEAGRFTLTQSSWTVPRDCSRKWMSGQAAALAAAKDRGHSARQTNSPTALREPLSAVRPPSLLDFYFSVCDRFEATMSSSSLPKDAYER